MSCFDCLDLFSDCLDSLDCLYCFFDLSGLFALFVFVDSSEWLCGAEQSCFLFLLLIVSVWTLRIVSMAYRGSWICLDCFNCLHRLDVLIGFWKTLDTLDCLYCFLDWVGLFVVVRLWIWFGLLDSLDCVYYFLDLFGLPGMLVLF